MAHRLVCVFGGSGFIGRHLVRRLAAAGDRVRVAVRDPEGAHFLKPMGVVGQIHAVAANLGHEGSIKAAVAGADLVVNLVGTLVSRGHQTFQTLHIDGPGAIARAAREAGVQALGHMSALGADAQSRSSYARSKAKGEQAMREGFPGAVILRPSVVFGPEDDFFNRFASLAARIPVLPIPRKSRFQPVYVGDVADAIVAGLNRTALAGQTFSLGGPVVYTLDEIVRMILSIIERHRLVIDVPLWVLAIQSAFLQLLPKPPLTPDQVRLLGIDNVLPPGAPGLAEIGIAPTAAEAIVPTYLARFHNPYAPREPRIVR